MFALPAEKKWQIYFVAKKELKIFMMIIVNWKVIIVLMLFCSHFTTRLQAVLYNVKTGSNVPSCGLNTTCGKGLALKC